MIQLLGSALIWISLGVATLAAVTAYRPTLDAVAAAETPLTLGMPVGVKPDEPTEDENSDPSEDVENAEQEQAKEEKKLTPLYEPPKDDVDGLKISPEMIDELKAQNVQRIGVKEFSFARWNEKYWFLGAVAGLLAGAVLMKNGAPQESNASSTEPNDDPIDALARAAVEVDRLVQDLETTNLDSVSRMNRVIKTLEQIDRDHIETFTSGGTRLTRQLGLSGFAQLMDSFAGAERKLNRSWSAAVDNNEAESLGCLRDGQQLLHEAMRRLDSLKNETL